MIAKRSQPLKYGRLKKITEDAVLFAPRRPPTENSFSNFPWNTKMILGEAKWNIVPLPFDKSIKYLTATCYCSMDTDVSQTRDEVLGCCQGPFWYWLIMHPWSLLYSGFSCLTTSSTALYLWSSHLSIWPQSCPNVFLGRLLSQV